MGDELKTTLDAILVDLSSIKNEVTTIKGDQSRLNVAVNRLQSDHHSSGGSHSGKDTEHGAPPPPPPREHGKHKLRFPRYDGSTDPVTWLHKAEQFFRADRTADDERVWLASFYMEGAAQDWYYRLEQNHGAPTWPDFVDKIQRAFGTPARSNPLGALMKLRRTGTVEEYKAQFLPMLARCRPLQEQDQIDIFTGGLRNPLQTDVELQHPTTLDDAMALARAFERRLELDEDEDSSTSRVPTRTNPPIRSRALPATSAPHTPPPAAKTVPQAPPAPTKGPPPAGPRFKRLTQQEMAQRRAEGLCFNCPEKFTKDHACMKKGLYLMELDDDTPVEDAAVEESSPTDDVEISIHALTGIKTADTMHLATSVAGTSIRALVDSGSTHSFIAADTARRLGLQPAPCPSLTMGVANGERVPSAGVCAAVPVTIGTEEFHIDLFVLPLADYELVLGCHWLRSLGPILWDLAR